MAAVDEDLVGGVDGGVRDLIGREGGEQVVDLASEDADEDYGDYF